MQLHLIEEIPANLAGHRIEEIDNTYLESLGILIIKDQNNKMNILCRASEYDDSDRATFQVILKEDEWSDASILDALIAPDEPLVDSCDIIRIRKNGTWWGYNTSETVGPAEMFMIAPELLENYVIMYVFPFCNGYARVVTRERWENATGMGIGYAICDTKGHLIFDHVFSYVLPQEQSEPGEARVMGHNWVIMRILIADESISPEAAVDKKHAGEMFRAIEARFQYEIDTIWWSLSMSTHPEEGSSTWQALNGFEYNPDSMLRLSDLYPRDVDILNSHLNNF